VAVRTEEVFARNEDVLAVQDIEALHDMRVATRRLRAALEVFEPCFARDPYRRALAEVKRLADVLGERRDRDVQIEWLERYAQARSGDERAAVLGFADALRDEQAVANEALAALLEEVDRDELQARLGTLAERAVGAGAARRKTRVVPAKKVRRAGKRHGKERSPVAERSGVAGRGR
jgi:CHAD domain-containing protein